MAAGPDLEHLRSGLRLPAAPGEFDDGETAGLPEPVRRHLRWAIAPGTALAQAADLTMSGTIRIGRWVPFRAEETIAPHVGFVWPARAMGAMAGSDRFVDGAGAMDWRLFGRWPVLSSEGPDVSRSAAHRGAAEGMWVPTALLPRFGVEWRALDESHLCASTAMGEHHLDLHLHVDPATGRLLRFHVERWGDPDQTDTWRLLPFGGDVTGWATFDGVTVASAARLGWWYGSRRFWSDGEFFRYRLLDLRLVR